MDVDPVVWTDQILRLYHDIGRWVLYLGAALYAFYLLCRYKPWFRSKD